MAQPNNKKGQRVPAHSSNSMVARLIFGVLLLALGVMLFLASAMRMTGDVFDGLRTFAQGMFGVMSYVLPVIPVWGGFLLAYSSLRKPPMRPFLLACLMMALLCATMTLLTFIGNMSNPLMQQIQSNIQQSRLADTMPHYLTQGYNYGRLSNAGGGLVGMLLGWPLWKLIGAIGGGIVTIVAAIVNFCFLIRLDVKGIIGKSQAHQEERRAHRAAQEAERRQQEIAWQQEQARLQQEQRLAQEQLRQQQIQQQLAQNPPMPQQPVYAPMPQQHQQGVPIVRQVQPRGQQQPMPQHYGFQPTPEELGQMNTAPQPVAEPQKKKRSLFSHDRAEEAASTPRKKSLFSRDAEEAPAQPEASPAAPQPVPSVRRGAPVPAEPVFMSEMEPTPRPASRREPAPAAPQPAAQPEAAPVRPARTPVTPPPAQPARNAVQPPEELDADFAAEAQEKPIREGSFLARLRAEKKARGLDVPENDAPVRPASPAPATKTADRPKARSAAATPAVDPMDIPPWEDIPANAEPAAPLRPVVTAKKPEGGYEPELNLKPRRSGVEPPVMPDAPKDIPYVFPPLNLLKMPEPPKTNSDEEDEIRSRRLENTLQSFKIPAKVRKITHGPTISRYELEIAAGINVSRVASLKNNIAMSMAAETVRIEAPIPGKELVGIEIPNATRTMVTLQEVLTSDVMAQAKGALVVALGKDIAGTPILCDLDKMPHLLIAGATGSGKSVCINTIIASLLYRYTPKEVRLIMIDPKVVELQCYNNLPHLLIPVVSDPHKASSALAWAVGEMESRYKAFEETGSRNITGYNEFMRKNGGETMPRIVVVVDELADLMMTCKKDVEERICRLAQLARAAGIHLIVATQRPSTDVITGLIKANIPSRIAFKVASNIDSRTILDSIGAEQLLGYGDMLYKPNGKFTPVRLQGCFLSDEEVNTITDYIRETSPTDYDPAVLEELERLQAEAEQNSNSASTDAAPAADDSISDAQLLGLAIEMAVNEGQLSTSSIQRRLRLGYSRAGRLVDEMERRGIVGPKDGAKPRKCLISREAFEAMRAAGDFD